MRTLVATATMLALLAPALAAQAQMKPMTPPAPAQSQQPPAAQASEQQKAPPKAQARPGRSQQQMMGGMMGGQGQGMMGGMMMCPMMAGMMGQGMMGQGMMGQGMPGMQGVAGARGMMHGPVDMSDPKAAARTLRLRGDLMKAMGEVMVKHAEALAQEK